MKNFPLEIGSHPEHVYRIGLYSVPRASRRAFEHALRRSADFLRTLPGFRGHVVLEKSGGQSHYDITTIAAWESEEALSNAATAMRDHQASIGFDLAARLAEWGVTFARGDYLSRRTDASK